MVEQDNKPKRALCMSCRFYFVTWDQYKPYGCRAFKFKSALLPCYDVQLMSNMNCQKYEARPKKR